MTNLNLLLHEILPLKTTNGLTVAELKRVIKNWPETNEDGEPCEVWLCGSNGLSNQAFEIWSLNMRYNKKNTKVWADMLIKHKF